MAIVIKKDEITGQKIEVVVGTPEIIHESIQALLDNGYEISWLITDKQSYSWEDFNELGVKQVLLAIFWVGFKEMTIGFLNHESKRTLYKNYEVE